MAVDLPFVPSIPFYRMGTTLNGSQYIFDLRWNGRDAGWYMDISEQDETPIVNGIKIVLGCYLGRRCSHTLFRDGVFVAIDTAGTRTDAGIDDLGTRVIVRYFTIEEVVAYTQF